MKAETDISIIICTHGRCKDLRETLQSLLEVKIPANLKVELLLVENGVRGEAEYLTSNIQSSAITVRYYFQSEACKSASLNFAMDQARGSIFLFSDDDIRFPSNWIEGMCRPILDGKADAVAGGVSLAPHLLRPWMGRIHRAWLASTADYLSPESPSELCGANMAFHRRVLEKVGGFDPELGPGITGAGEETLFSWQLQEAGFSIFAALDVTVEHHPDMDRLLYQQWNRTADLRGITRAYLAYHWQHKNLPHAFVRSILLSTKLHLRRIIEANRSAEDEGIAPWELSYLQDISDCRHFLRERKKPRKYKHHGLHKLEPSRTL